MGSLNFSKKKQTGKQHSQSTKITFTETILGKTSKVTVGEYDTEPTDFKHLTKKGDLPFGWIYRNKEFTDRINNEYSHFLHKWLDARDKSPKELYQALKSFVSFLEDAEKLCKSKGECFEFWFYNILVSKDYIEKRKDELENLIANFDKLQSNYKKRNDMLPGLDNKIIKMLKDAPGVLQSDFLKMFDPLVQSDVREKLYFMEKSGKLERTKSGRSYILYYKGVTLKGVMFKIYSALRKK